MKIKTLLLGSAAALVAVSGARQAGFPFDIDARVNYSGGDALENFSAD